jgi:hypothetical protein
MSGSGRPWSSWLAGLAAVLLVYIAFVANVIAQACPREYGGRSAGLCRCLGEALVLDHRHLRIRGCVLGGLSA